MKHTYLSERIIKDALLNHAITAQEAEKLQGKIEAQISIYKAIKK